MSTAALAHPLHPQLGDSPSLRLLPTTPLVGPVPPFGPALRVLEGGRAPARVAQRATYRRRRSVALGLLATLVVALVLLVGAVSTRLAGGGHPSSAAGANPPTSAVALSAAEVAATSWVVAPGDTLWSIAARVAPDADVRATVDRLVQLNGNDPIAVGQHLRLP